MIPDRPEQEPQPMFPAPNNVVPLRPEFDVPTEVVIMDEVVAPTPEHKKIGPEQIVKDVSSSVSLYPVLSMLTHREATAQVFEAIRPPYVLRGPDDLGPAGARDYYAKFIMLATKRDESGKVIMIEDQFEAAKHIYTLLRPTAAVLKMMLDEHEVSEIPQKAVNNTVKILDMLTRQVAKGNVVL
jgi:hypothetical protein